MKKIIFAFIFVSIIGLNHLYAQCIIDASITHPGTYPDSITGLPHAKVGSPYSTVIQFRVFKDTVYLGAPATADSVLIASVSGFPSGFNYQCNPSACSFPGGSNGCILVTGTTPTSGMEGAYPLTIHLNAYGKVNGYVLTQPIPYTITFYKILIDSVNVGIADLNSNKFSLSQNYPDPATKMTDIFYSVPVSGLLEFKIYNLLGKIVYQKSFFAERGTGRITLDSKDFAPGIYIYNLNNGKAMLTRRMVMAYN